MKKQEEEKDKTDGVSFSTTIPKEEDTDELAKYQSALEEIEGNDNNDPVAPASVETQEHVGTSEGSFPVAPPPPPQELVNVDLIESAFIRKYDVINNTD